MTADTSPVQWQRSSTANEVAAAVEVAMLGDGLVAMRDSRTPNKPSLVFNRAEWTAFVAGARRGEFTPTTAERDT